MGEDGRGSSMVWGRQSRGRGKEGCALLFSPREWKGIETNSWKGSRIVWAVWKIGMVKYV